MKKSPESTLEELVRVQARYAAALAACQADAPAIFAALRKKLGLSQQDLAGKMGVTNVYLSRIENGHMVPGYSTLAALRDAVKGGEGMRKHQKKER
jgi:ribosome-binding protein aMBF1 (putative translation factor)